MDIGDRLELGDPGPTGDAATVASGRVAAAAAAPWHQATIWRWLRQDSPFIAMLLLALAGVIFRLPVSYWIILTPVFGVISIVAGWPHFETGEARLDMMFRQTMCWCALLVAIFLLYNTGVQGVLNANSSALTMMTLLAMGTFVAGVQADVWRICAVGLVLFLAVPGLGWLDQSPLLVTVATCLFIALGGVAWWINQRK
jgi:hypothetical protein